MPLPTVELVARRYPPLVRRLASALQGAWARSHLARDRQARSAQVTARTWWSWPVSLLMFAYGLAGLAWSVYQRWLVGSLFTLFWLALLSYISWPDRRSWQLHRDERRRRKHRG